MKNLHKFLLPMLCLAPLILWGVARQDIKKLLDDSRPIYSARALESISGSGAGKRIEVRQKEDVVSHKVRYGETWTSIAGAYQIRDIAALIQHNKREAGSTLKVGEVIEIPTGLTEAGR